MRRSLLAGMGLMLAFSLRAQSFQRHHFTGGLGIAIPKDDLHAFYQNAFSWTFSYGYRPLRYLQLDAGMDSSYLAADVEDYYNSPAFGPIRIRDFQYFFPYGARAILPLAKGRFELYGGAGGAYLWYVESLRQPSYYYRVDCPVCNSRSGPGWYAMAGGDFALDQRGNFRLGAVTRMYRGHTEGRAVGTLPPVRTKDRWLNAYVTFTFAF
ncbi:MAG: hypothetical protein IT161_04850 [Bryobacterales bacterium]|nr:hypothetical protein [Bryobacterales bacterium]